LSVDLDLFRFGVSLEGVAVVDDEDVGAVVGVDVVDDVVDVADVVEGCGCCDCCVGGLEAAVGE
jgi:hypothetical protein